ncbi:MAG: hypothetical protein ACFE8F_12375, partial [Promethearchaeota archaeon]
MTYSILDEVGGITSRYGISRLHDIPDSSWPRYKNDLKAFFLQNYELAEKLSKDCEAIESQDWKYALHPGLLYSGLPYLLFISRHVKIDYVCDEKEAEFAAIT